VVGCDLMGFRVVGVWRVLLFVVFCFGDAASALVRFFLFVCFICVVP